MTEVAKTNIPILHNSAKMKKLVKTEQILRSKRQPKNLKRLLTRARFTTEPTDNSVDRCGDTRCGTCKYIAVGGRVVLKNGKVITPNSKLNCKSKNLIYCITCSGCSENYIGQTGNSLCERMRVHRQQIRSKETRQIPLSGHLDSCGNGVFSVFPFHKMTDNSFAKRQIKENNFIKLFSPKLNADNI